MAGHYKQRLESHMFEILSDLLAREARDPRLDGVVVTGVELNADYSVAKVFTMGGEEDAQGVLRGAASFLRSEVARFLKMKSAPELRFHEDESLERYNRVEEILESPPAAAEGADPDASEPEPADPDAP